MQNMNTLRMQSPPRVILSYSFSYVWFDLQLQSDIAKKKSHTNEVREPCDRVPIYCVRMCFDIFRASALS